MATNPHPSPGERQRWTDYRGTGQSGYTAGRAADLALERKIQTEKRALAYGDFDEEQALRCELGTDDRFRGF